MEPEVIWENRLKDGWHVVVESIGDNMNRGNLKIYSQDDTLHYQREVGVNRRIEFGGSEANFREWERVVTTWIHQFS